MGDFERSSESAAKVAGLAADQATHVLGDAKEQTGAVAHEASRQAQDLVGQTKQQLQDQARGRTDELARSLHRWSDQGHALAEGRSDQAGEVSRYVERASDKLSELAERVDRRGFDGMVDDVSRFARRKPGVFLLGAGVAGFVVGRLLRGANASRESDGSSANGNRVTSAVGAPPTGTGPVLPGPAEDAVARVATESPVFLPPAGAGGR